MKEKQMKSISSGRTRRHHQKHKRTKKKRSYVKHPKRLKKEIKTVSKQSQDELEPITSPMSDE